MKQKSIRKQYTARPGWSLTHGIFEVFWKRGPGGLYADRVRICGATFWYISGKKTKAARSERRGGGMNAVVKQRATFDDYQCSECYEFQGRHREGCSLLRPFPIQHGGSIPWWLAEEAFTYYHSRWPGQSLERLAERGGFGVTELLMFLRRDEKHGKHYAWETR